MALIDWSDDLSVKVAAFDNHHKKLINLINELHISMRAGKAQELIGKIIKNLLDYTKYHFGEEEKLMAAHNYPEYAEHKMQHDTFVAKVQEFSSRFEKGSTAVTIDLMNFLRNWLTGHIVVNDKKYSPFFESRKVA